MRSGKGNVVRGYEEKMRIKRQIREGNQIVYSKSSKKKECDDSEKRNESNN